MKWLLCEGPCNPQLARIDAAILHAHLDSVRQRNVIERIPFDRNPYKGCRYTEHLATTVDHVFQCRACRTERQYGSSAWKMVT